jgi:hypothetical protein
MHFIVIVGDSRQRVGWVLGCGFVGPGSNEYIAMALGFLTLECSVCSENHGACHSDCKPISLSRSVISSSW